MIQEFGLCRAEKDHFVFWWIQDEKRIMLIVCVDDNVITGDKIKRIDSMKKHFQNKDFRSMKYFLGIKVDRSMKDIFLSQRKYILDLLSEAGMIECRSIDSPMDVNTKWIPDRESCLRMLGGTGD